MHNQAFVTRKRQVKQRDRDELIKDRKCVFRFFGVFLRSLTRAGPFV